MKINKKVFLSVLTFSILLGVICGVVHASPADNSTSLVNDTSSINSLVEDDAMIDSTEGETIEKSDTNNTTNETIEKSDTDNTEVLVETDTNIDTNTSEEEIDTPSVVPLYDIDDVVERLDICIAWFTLIAGFLFWTIVLFVCFWIAWICLKQFNRFI